MKQGMQQWSIFSGDIDKENLGKVCLNDIPSNSARMQMAEKDPVA